MNLYKEALTICLNEMLDYIEDVPEDNDSEDNDYYSNYDRETANLVYEMKYALGKLFGSPTIMTFAPFSLSSRTIR